MVHFDCSDEARFELHSIDTFNAMVDDLVSQLGVLSERKFGFRERVRLNIKNFFNVMHSKVAAPLTHGLQKAAR